jgi:hypothetical protein
MKYLMPVHPGVITFEGSAPNAGIGLLFVF